MKLVKLIPKTNKNSIKFENHRPISYINTDGKIFKNINQKNCNEHERKHLNQTEFVLSTKSSLTLENFSGTTDKILKSI